MKKATIESMGTGDRLAKFYSDKGQGSTIFEVVLNTRADFGERVKLLELGAERSVLISRWVHTVKVAHFTADEWLVLRGMEEADLSVIDAARQLVATTPAAAPASHAKARSKPPASARD